MSYVKFASHHVLFDEYYLGYKDFDSIQPSYMAYDWLTAPLPVDLKLSFKILVN